MGTASQPSVGWIGLGRIGLPMARRVLAAGLPLRVWARDRGQASPLLAEGAQWSETPEALAGASSIVATIVRGSDDVRALYQRMLPAAQRGSLFVDMTTAAPECARDTTALAARAGIVALDAPVTGGVAGAKQGTLTAFVGGDAEALDRAQALLTAFCSRIVHCGGPGAGYRMKLVNQTIVAGVLVGLANGAALARAGGFDADTVRQALGTGTASGPLFDSYLTRMMPAGGTATFTLGMLRKDLTLARAEAEAAGSGTNFLDHALATADAACARHGEHAGVQYLTTDAA